MCVCVCDDDTQMHYVALLTLSHTRRSSKTRADSRLNWILLLFSRVLSE